MGPVGNITIYRRAADSAMKERGDGAKPVRQGNCEKCMSCIQWCPEQAVQFDDKTIDRKRYHHPEVSLSDIL